MVPPMHKNHLYHGSLTDRDIQLHHAEIAHEERMHDVMQAEDARLFAKYGKTFVDLTDAEINDELSAIHAELTPLLKKYGLL
jgi:hypothetical protein